MLPCVPETVQTPVVVEVKLTVRSEVAVAESVRGVPTVWVGIVPKLMVCEVAAFTIMTGLGLATWDKLPLVPLTVRLYAPGAVDDVESMVIVDDAPAAIGLGLKVSEIPEGRLLDDRVTSPLNPFKALADTV